MDNANDSGNPMRTKPVSTTNPDSTTRSRVGKSPWVFRLSLCLVDFTAMVFRHVLLAASFFGTAGNELGQQIFAFFGKITRVTLGLGMCKVCTEAVHSVAL